MIKAVAFDLWYTLIYLENGWKAFNFLKDIFNIADEEWKNVIKPIFLCQNLSSEAEFITKLQDAIGYVDKSQELVETMVKQRNYDINNTLLYLDALPVLNGLQKMNISIGIISNQTSLYQLPYHKLGISKFVDVEIFSCDLGVRKPHITMYSSFCEQMGISPHEALMIGDNFLHDFFTPTSFGMKALHLVRNKTEQKYNSLSVSSLSEIWNYLA